MNRYSGKSLTDILNLNQKPILREINPSREACYDFNGTQLKIPIEEIDLLYQAADLSVTEGRVSEFEVTKKEFLRKYLPDESIQ